MIINFLKNCLLIQSVSIMLLDEWLTKQDWNFYEQITQNSTEKNPLK